MRKLIFMFLVTVLLPFYAAAQNKEHHGQGYVFVAPGTSSEGGLFLHIGGGGEGLVYKGMGVGGEIGYLGASGLSNGVGVISPNVSYNFSKSSGFSPFVTGGYTLFFRGESYHAGNIGAGMNWWFKDHLGLRLEVRDHIVATSPKIHIVGIRIGLSFR